MKIDLRRMVFHSTKIAFDDLSTKEEFLFEYYDAVNWFTGLRIKML